MTRFIVSSCAALFLLAPRPATARQVTVAIGAKASLNIAARKDRS